MPRKGTLRALTKMRTKEGGDQENRGRLHALNRDEPGLFGGLAVTLAGSLAILVVDLSLDYSAGFPLQLLALGAGGFGHFWSLRRSVRNRLKGDRGPWIPAIVIMAIGLPCLILAGAHWGFLIAGLIGGSCFAGVIMTSAVMLCSEKTRAWRLRTILLVAAGLSLGGVLGQAVLASAIDHNSAMIFGLPLVFLPTLAGIFTHVSWRRHIESETNRQDRLKRDFQRQAEQATRIKNLRQQHGDAGR